MPLKLNVGASKKVGESNYGSRGASVNLEMELDSGLMNDPPKLQEKIRALFGLVRTSLAEELNGNGHDHAPANGNGHSQPPANGNGAERKAGQNQGAPRPSTASQVKALHAIAKSQNLDLSSFLRKRFDIARAESLTIKEASEAIDALKSSQLKKGA